MFGDNFAGAAGSAPSAANWFYDIGTGYGTGETEQTTNSTSNVYLDGNGHLVLKAIDNGGTWTSGRIESTRDDFAAPPGGKLEMTASIEQPNPANGLGYWPAFWALGSPMRTGGGWPQSGEIDMMEDVNGLNEASQTFHNSANSPGHPLIACPGAGSGCQTGYHTYTVIVDRTNTSAETMQFLMDGVVESTITEASVGTAAWQAAVDHGFFIIFDLAMGGNYPDGVYGSTTPTSATSSGASMSVGYVAVYEEGGNSTPTATASATGTVTGLSGLCLANQNSLNTSGNPIGVSGCNGSAGQQWSPYSDGTLRTQGGCLDVVSAGTSSGTNVDWYPCNGTAAQNWTHQANGELVNPSSGLCLTVPGANTGARLDIETCTDSAQQQWTLPTGSGGGGGGGSGGTCGTTNLALNKTATASSTRERGLPRGQRGGRQHRHPLVQRVLRPAVAGGRPRLQSQAICQVTLQWETAYATAFQIQTSADGTNWTTIYSTTTGTGGTQTLNVTGTGRYIRMYGTARATQYGYSLWEFSVYGTGSGGGGGTCGTTNLALNKTATASSTENASFPASAAVDGNTGTRWSSAFSDPQWLEVDLGSSQAICQVTLNWETAYATAFQIQTSADGTNWTTIYSTTTGTGGTQTLNVTGTGRYIRMYGTARATQYGYSLWEFQVLLGLEPASGGPTRCSHVPAVTVATARRGTSAARPGC